MIRHGRTKQAPTSGRRGYALVLVMVALVTLTILGVTSITATQLDMKITQNMRHHKALQYGAMTGQDHGREMMAEGVTDPQTAFNNANMAGDANHCTAGWIADSGGDDVPVDVSANGFMLADYTVDMCGGVCVTTTPAGWGLGRGNDKFSAMTLDLLSTGSMSTVTADAQAGGMLFMVAKMKCDGI